MRRACDRRDSKEEKEDREEEEGFCTLIILRGRLLFAIGGEIRGRCGKPRLLAEAAATLEEEQGEESRKEK